jgi:hypothetical protein
VIKAPLSNSRERVRDFVPKLIELSEKVLYDDVWEGPGLSKRDRSLVTVAHDGGDDGQGRSGRRGAAVTAGSAHASGTRRSSAMRLARGASSICRMMSMSSACCCEGRT